MSKEIYNTDNLNLNYCIATLDYEIKWFVTSLNSVHKVHLQFPKIFKAHPLVSIRLTLIIICVLDQMTIAKRFLAKVDDICDAGTVVEMWVVVGWKQILKYQLNMWTVLLNGDK